MTALSAMSMLAAVNSLILTGIFLYLLLGSGDRAVRTWFYSWAFYSLRLLANVFVTLAGSSQGAAVAAATLVNHSAAVISGFLLLVGSYQYVGRKTPHFWQLLAVVVLAWTVGALAAGASFLARAMPAYAFLGIGTVTAGLVIPRGHEGRRLGNLTASVALVLWGLHKFNYPILRPMEAFAPYGYLIGAALAVTVGASLLVSILEKNQAALLRSESRFKGTVQAMDDSVFTVDATGRFTGVFGGWAEAFSGGVDRIVGRAFEETFGERTAGLHREKLPRVLKGETAVFEWTRREGAADRHIQTTLSPIRGPQGAVIGAVGVGRDITDLKRTEARLQAGIRERETLLREIHHRVKNNLQVVSSLIHLQTARVSDPRSAELFEATAARVVAMAMVHEQLYVSESLSEIDLSAYIRHLVELIASSHVVDRLNVTKDVRTVPVHIEVERAVPCALIVNELVSNAFKHAFPGRSEGRIEVILALEEDRESAIERVCLTVTDDGVGPPIGERVAAPGLGSVLISELSAQLGATVERSNHPGTTVRVAFPRYVALPVPPAEL